MGEASILETKRLRLRSYRLDDLDEAFAMLGDVEHMRYYPHPFDRHESLAWIERQLDSYGDNGFGLWVIEDKGTHEFLGNCGPTIQVVEGVREVELGWHVKRTHWGEGIAPEAAAACRDWCFGNLGVDHLISLVRPENVPSRRVAEKIGMTVWRETTHGSVRWLHLVLAIGRNAASPAR